MSYYSKWKSYPSLYLKQKTSTTIPVTYSWIVAHFHEKLNKQFERNLKLTTLELTRNSKNFKLIISKKLLLFWVFFKVPELLVKSVMNVKQSMGYIVKIYGTLWTLLLNYFLFAGNISYWVTTLRYWYTDTWIESLKSQINKCK